MRFLKHLFSFDGRIGRLNYFLHSALVSIAFLIVSPFLFFALLVEGLNEPQFVIIVVGLTVFISEISATVRRLHDLNRSGWQALWTFVPAVNLVLVLCLFFMQGTKGPNRFGSDPLEVKEKSPMREFSGAQSKTAKKNVGGRFDRG